MVETSTRASAMNCRLVPTLRCLQPFTRLVLLVEMVFLPALAIAQVRTWTDNTGRYKIEAEFDGVVGGTRQRKTVVGGKTVSVHVDGGTVRLKQLDGELVSIRFERLSDADKAYVRRSLAARTKADLIASLKKALLQPVSAETTARRDAEVRQRLTELSQRFDGRRITLRFPIKDVIPSGDLYYLDLGQPDFAREPGAPVSSDGLKGYYPKGVELPLSRGQALAIDRSSILVVSGYVWLERDNTDLSSFLRPRSPPDDDSPEKRFAESQLEALRLLGYGYSAAPETRGEPAKESMLEVCPCVVLESRLIDVSIRVSLLSPRHRIGKVGENDPDDFDAPSQVFVSSRKSPIFHKPGCEGEKVYLRQDRVYYSSREAAIRAGKKPCGSCKP